MKADAFGEHVEIGQSTITPLYGEQFEGIRRLLAAENKLPGHLAKARPGEKNLRAITDIGRKAHQLSLAVGYKPFTCLAALASRRPDGQKCCSLWYNGTDERREESLPLPLAANS